MSIIIRAAEQKDADKKGYVHYTSWQETYKGLMSQEYLDKMSVEKCINIAKKYPENTLIAEVDGNIVGFACYSQCRDDNYESYGEVIAIYVLQDYQKKGIGKMLMDECINRLSKYRGIVLWVLDGNKRAIDFYKTYGFSFDGCKKEAVLVTLITELRMIKSIE